MRDTERFEGGGRRASALPRASLLLVAAMLIVGVAVAAGGMTAGEGSGATDRSQGDELAVTEWCENGTTYLAVENPTTDPVDVVTSWTAADDATSIRVESERVSRADTEAHSARTRLRTEVETDETGTTYALTVSVPADGYLLFVGLDDGTYELSTPVESSLEKTDVELECEGIAAEEGTGTEVPPAVADGIEEFEDELATAESDGSILALSADSDRRHVTKHVVSLETMDVGDAVSGLAESDDEPDGDDVNPEIGVEIDRTVGEEFVGSSPD